MADEVALAREGLLDALDALAPHKDALILVGAQAIYLHTGSSEISLAEFTTDGDLAVNPQLLSSEPLVEQAMYDAGFTIANGSSIGTWHSLKGIPVDLMVPAAVAGSGRRGARIPPHGASAMRKTRGLEAALIDNAIMLIEPINMPSDSRSYEISVAGPSALLVAKLHKIHDRIANPSRLDNKDAHDVYRLLRQVELTVFVKGLTQLLANDLSSDITREALVQLQLLFALGPDAPGSQMAGAAEIDVGNPLQVAESIALLAQELLNEIE